MLEQTKRPIIFPLLYRYIIPLNKIAIVLETKISRVRTALI